MIFSNTITMGKGRLFMVLTYSFIGKDLLISITGGENIQKDMHIGASALGSPSNEWYTNAISPHKDIVLIEQAIETLKPHMATINANICITSGVHLDQITKEEIQDTIALTKELVKEFIEKGLYQ